MKTFSIGDLEKLSSIKKHTIRIWEHRYAIFSPQRSKCNIRHYDLEDVAYFLNLALLNENGYKISKLSKLEPTDVAQIIKSLKDDENRLADMLNQLIVCMYAADIETFEDALDAAVLFWGIDTTIEKLIIPFMEIAGILSYEDNSSEIHFAVTALRKKLILGIEKTNPTKILDHKILLFLPKGEHYDLMLLYLTYLAKTLGYKVLYLGTNISNECLKPVINSKKPHLLITYITPLKNFDFKEVLKHIQQQLPEATLIITRSESINSNCNFSNLRCIHYKELHALLKAPDLKQEMNN